MKEPKSFRYPRLYWTPNPKKEASELRIVYPDGHKPERTNMITQAFAEAPLSEDFRFTPCWYFTMKYPQLKSSQKQVLAMKKWCRKTKNKLIFIGEIK